MWAGMRGAVTVAAAQTLPLDAPQRSVLVLIAFTAALLSLVVQGGTLGPVLRALRTAPAAGDPEGSEEGRRDPEQVRLREMLREVSESVEEPSLPLDADERTQRRMRGDRFKAVLEAQRAALLDARDDGLFDADLLEEALVDVDASQIAIELRDRHRG